MAILHGSPLQKKRLPKALTNVNTGPEVVNLNIKPDFKDQNLKKLFADLTFH